MPISLEKDCFKGMDEVYDLLKDRKLWPVMAVHNSMTAEAPHWHTQNNQIFVVEGEAEFCDGETGTWYKATSGDIAIVPRRTLHAARADGRVVLIAAFDTPTRLADFHPYPPEALD